MTADLGAASAKMPGHPAFRYFGGKWTLADWIIGHFPRHKVYVEPFGGSASVLMRKKPARVEVYNDVDEDVTRYFRVMRDQEARAELLAGLRLTPYSRAELRCCQADEGGGVERVRRFLVRSQMSIGGNGRPERRAGLRRGSAKELMESRRAVHFCNWADGLEEVAERLREVIFEQMDFRRVIPELDSADTLFYCDPPYLAATRPNSQAEYAHDLAEAGHRDLASILAGIKGMAVVSGYRSPLYDELFEGWARKDREARATSNGKRIESIWLSPRAEAACGQRLF